ncbi:MAG: non-ribosomal peptide synthetase [Tumebacillaceae bacterium]
MKRNGELLEKQLAYWKNQLAGEIPVLQLPTDRPRPRVQSYRGAYYTTFISKELTEHLKSICTKEGVTLFMILLTAFKTLLYRYTGQEDMVVGTPIAGRNRREVEGPIGYFVNSLVLRTNLSGAPSFKELLRRVRDTSLAAFANQDVPFESLVEALHPERNLSHSPLFQVMFAFQHAGNEQSDLEGLQVGRVDAGIGISKFDLTLAMTESPEGIQAVFEFSTDLYNRDTIERMAEQYRTLLTSIVADLTCPIAQLKILPADEHEKLMVQWNDTTVDYPTDELVHHMFERIAQEHPDAIALEMFGKQMTYRELNERANQLAHRLIRMGMQAEDVVGVFAGRSFEMVIGKLATMKSGATYMPIDPQYPADRIAFQCVDSDVKVVLTQKKLYKELPDVTVDVLVLDDMAEELRSEPVDNPNADVHRQNLVYLVYTSGSTGRPKGVEIRHGGLLNLTHWMHHTYSMTSSDRTTQLGGVAFDAGAIEMWAGLTIGACVSFTTEEIRRDPQKLRDWLIEQKITFCFVPAPLMEGLLALEWPTDTALRTVWTGGEKMLRFPGPEIPFTVTNQYGPTEATVFCTSGVIAPKQANTAQHPTIGRAITNTKIYVLDKNQELVPIGVPGELYVGGAGIARGYHNRAELTAEKFVPNPFDPQGKELLYRTGDLVRYLPDGNLDYVGRIDHQVKIRGFRIEVGAIESILRTHPDVREALVLVFEVEGTKQLVAYLIREHETTESTSEIRAFLKKQLPDYMIPVSYAWLDHWPLTPNGKLDKPKLPAP